MYNFNPVYIIIVITVLVHFTTLAVAMGRFSARLQQIEKQVDNDITGRHAFMAMRNDVGQIHGLLKIIQLRLTLLPCIAGQSCTLEERKP